MSRMQIDMGKYNVSTISRVWQWLGYTVRFFQIDFLENVLHAYFFLINSANYNNKSSKIRFT